MASHGFPQAPLAAVVPLGVNAFVPVAEIVAYGSNEAIPVDENNLDVNVSTDQKMRVR